jgi:hypothetical protein
MSTYIANASTQWARLFYRTGTGANGQVPPLAPGGQIEITSDAVFQGVLTVTPGIIPAADAPDGYIGLMYSASAFDPATLYPQSWPSWPPPRQPVTSYP